MSASAFPGLQFPKTPPGVLMRRAKARAQATEWSRVCRQVDARDGRRCQVTGVPLSASSADPWRALERHHLEPRSRSRRRALQATNVLTVARAVHQLIHAGALALLTTRGAPCLDVRTLSAVRWNRQIVAKGQEPCRVLRGLRVVEGRAA